MAAVAKREGGAESSLHSKHKKILGGGPSLDIVFISLADPSQEMDGVGVAQVPLKHLEHVLLHQEDFIFGV